MNLSLLSPADAREIKAETLVVDISMQESSTHEQLSCFEIRREEKKKDKDEKKQGENDE